MRRGIEFEWYGSVMPGAGCGGICEVMGFEQGVEELECPACADSEDVDGGRRGGGAEV